jgi:hypothetical protein
LDRNCETSGIAYPCLRCPRRILHHRARLNLSEKAVYIGAISRACDCAPNAIGSTMFKWPRRRIDHRNPTYSHRWEKSVRRHDLPYQLLPWSVMIVERRGRRGAFCRRISAPRSNTSMIKNLSDYFLPRWKNVLDANFLLVAKRSDQSKTSQLFYLKGS